MLTSIITSLHRNCCYRTKKSLKGDHENCDDSHHHTGGYDFWGAKCRRRGCDSRYSQGGSRRLEQGDADAYSRYFAEDGTFTNLLGMFFQGREAFRERHQQIFQGAYGGSTKQSDVVSLKFVRPDVAIVESLQTVSGFKKLLPGTSADAKGRLRTRLLQVLVKESGEWKIATYHNIDVKSGIQAPEPQ